MGYPTCTLTGCNLLTPAGRSLNCGPEVHDGEITAIYITDTALTDPALADLVTNLDQAGGATKVIKIPCQATWQPPDRGETETEGGTVFNPKATHSVSGTIHDFSDSTYTLARQLGCNKPVLAYFEMGGYIYGGEEDVEDGIPTTLQIVPTGPGRDTLAAFEINFSWRSQYIPERAASPF